MTNLDARRFQMPLRCKVCGEMPWWTVTRSGETLRFNWQFACQAHLAEVCDQVQQPKEVIDLIVTRAEVVFMRMNYEDMADEVVRDRTAHGDEHWK